LKSPLLPYEVFVHIQVSIQYRILIDMVYSADYRLSDPRLQIRSYVFDVVRAEVPRLSLDDVFGSKSAIAASIQSRLRTVMRAPQYLSHSEISPRNQSRIGYYG